MQDRFQFLPRRGVAEDERAHLRAVERAVGGDVVGAERFAQRGHRGAAGRGQLVRDRVGVDDAGAELREHVRGGWTCREPMPPVRPITNGMRSEQILEHQLQLECERVEAQDSIELPAPEQQHHARRGEVRPEAQLGLHALAGARP